MTTATITLQETTGYFGTSMNGGSDQMRDYGLDDPAALLEVHPNSYLAHRLLATIAGKEGRRQEATAHGDNADAILRGGRDQLLIKYMPNDQLQQLLRSTGRLAVIE